MRTKTKRTIGWGLLASLLLGMIFGIPLSVHLFGRAEIIEPWYLVSFQVLGVLAGIAVLVGIVMVIVNLISSEDQNKI